MKNKKIILAGGTGFIGEEMTKYFGKENNIIILTRQVKNEKNNRNDYISLSDTNLNKPQDEYTGEFHDDFSVQVCKRWEKTFYYQQTPQTRKVALRMAITLGPGGILVPYFNLLKFGLGGKQASGKQMYSWVHIEDTCRIIEWIYEHKEKLRVFTIVVHQIL